MKKIDMEKEEKLSMTRELKFKELQEKIDEEEADKIVEEAIKKSKRKASTKNVTTELEQEIDQLLEVETKKRGGKVKKVEVDNIEEAKLTRLHNNSNVIAVSALNENALEIIKIFLETEFSNDERHIRRVEKIIRYEETNEY